LILLCAFVTALVGGVGATGPAHAASVVGKTGLYKDSCGNTHVWVNGQDLGPEYFVCIPPE
jgi:hypothetical protein